MSGVLFLLSSLGIIDIASGKGVHGGGLLGEILSTPFVALFGPTDPLRHIAPSDNYIVIKKDLKCSPCYNPNCLKGFKCMKNITVEEVFDASKKLLSKSVKAVS